MVKNENINVIDLDKTLIPYDSFRMLIIKEAKKMNLFIIGIIVLRKLKLISSQGFKEKIIRYLTLKYDDEFFKNFADKLYKDIDKKIMALINEHTDTGTINVLLSASPDCYVQFLIKKMNWQGSGSYFKNNVFVHLYGIHKINWLLQIYDSETFNYNFAISDSSSDDELLALFNKKIKLIKI